MPGSGTSRPENDHMNCALSIKAVNYKFLYAIFELPWSRQVCLLTERFFFSFSVHDSFNGVQSGQIMKTGKHKAENIFD